MIEWTLIIRGKAEEFSEVPPGAEIESVDGDLCVGKCEVCEEPIIVGDPHFHDSEGVIWHTECEDISFQSG